MSEPATKQDLNEVVGVLRGEMKATAGELRDEIKATAGELRDEIKATAGELRDEIKATAGELRDEMTGMEARLRGEMDQIRGDVKVMKTELLLEIGAAISHATNVMAEHFSRHFALLDDKLGDLAQRQKQLRADVDTHVADLNKLGDLAQRQNQLRADVDTHVADLSLHVRRPAAPAK